MAEKQLIVALEGTAALGPYWQTILSDYLEKIIRSFCGKDMSGQKQATVSFELALVMFTSHGSYCASLVQRSGWTRDVDIFLKCLSTIPFGGGRFNDAAIAEGLSEALMMFAPNISQTQQNVEVKKHCVLVSASNPYPLPTTIYRPKFQSTENDTVEAVAESCLSDAETIAKSYSQGFVSLSVICPKQLPKLRTIFNAGKRNPWMPDPPVDNENAHSLVLVSENFIEAQAALSRMPQPSGNLQVAASMAQGNLSGPQMVAMNQIIMNGLGPAGSSTGNGSLMPTPEMTQQMQSVNGGNNPGASMSLSHRLSSALQTAQSKYVKVWEGNLFGPRQGQPVFITRLEGCRSASASETLAANWPPIMQIIRLISQDPMNNKQYVGQVDFLVFRAINQHGFLRQMLVQKLCAVIQLPSQTLLLSVLDKDCRLIGMLFPEDMVVYMPEMRSQQQQQPMQMQQQPMGMQQQQQEQQPTDASAPAAAAADV